VTDYRGMEPTDEPIPLGEILGGFMTAVMFAACMALPACAFLVLVRTPHHLKMFARQEVELPALTAFFFSPRVRLALLLVSVFLFIVFAVVWSRGLMRTVAVVAPLLFVLALTLGGVWLHAMALPRKAPGDQLLPMLEEPGIRSAPAPSPSRTAGATSKRASRVI